MGETQEDKKTRQITMWAKDMRGGWCRYAVKQTASENTKEVPL